MHKAKKIYLLYPPISKMERYSSKLGEAGGSHIPLGIYYLSSYLQQNKFEVKATDAEANDLTINDILNEIEIFSPSFVGISSTTVAFHRALECAEEIKSNFSELPIILGGPHITSNYKHAMAYDSFDFGVIKEGEITLIELLKTLIEGNSLEDIKGIIYKDKNKHLILNPEREYIDQLDILPFPAYDLITDISLYQPPPSNYKSLPVISIITSRGCPYQCTFCDKNVFGRRYRERSAENIFEEIKYLYNKYHIREIAFVDDTLFINKDRLVKLFKLLDNERLFFHWTCASRINNVDYEFLKFVKSKGCWHISFGLESGDAEILKLIKKGIKIDQARIVIDWCNELGIKTKGFFIIGHPGETIDTINRTINFSKELKLNDIVVTINTPIPGSPQFSEVTKYGTLDKTDWSQFNYWRPVFIPNGLTEESLLKKQKEMYRKFYLRPRIIYTYLKSFFGRGGLGRLFTIAKASLYLFLKENK